MAEDLLFGFVQIETEKFQLDLELSVSEVSTSRTVQLSTEDFVFYFEGVMTEDTTMGTIRFDNGDQQVSKSWEFTIPDQPRIADADVAFVEDYGLFDIL